MKLNVPFTYLLVAQGANLLPFSSALSFWPLVGREAQQDPASNASCTAIEALINDASTFELLLGHSTAGIMYDHQKVLSKIAEHVRVTCDHKYTLLRQLEDKNAELEAEQQNSAAHLNKYTMLREETNICKTANNEMLSIMQKKVEVRDGEAKVMEKYGPLYLSTV